MLKVTNNVKVKKVKYTARDIQNYSTTVILPMVQELYDRLKLDKNIFILKKWQLRRKKMTDTKEIKEVKRKVYRSFTCETVANGFIVTVGCQRLVFKSLLEVANLLTQYWDYPDIIEKKVLSESIVYGAPVSTSGCGAIHALPSEGLTPTYGGSDHA